MPDETKLLTSRDAAKIIGVSPNVITRLANTGKIESQQLGMRRVFTSEGVDRYLRNQNLFKAPVDHERKTQDLPAIVALSFFSGVGGLDLGLENAGIPSLLYCENNRECRMSIDANRPDAALVGDINNISSQEIKYMARIPEGRDVDVMFGGPPCQAFSTAGARRAFNDARGNIFLRYLDIAAEIRPRYLVIENVRGLLSTPFPLKPGGKNVHGGAMQTILTRLHSMGYEVSFNLYNAANFGAAQIRERVVLIAKRDGMRAPWLTPTNSNDPKWGLPDWISFAEATADIEGSPQHHADFPEKRLKFFRMLKEGQCWNSLPKAVQREAMGKAFDLGGGKTGFYRRLNSNRPSPTLVTSPIMPATDLCHPIEDRPLSIEEYKAIQGFPASWKIAGNISDIYRQIGNAVPIKLGEAIGRTLLADMAGIVPDNKWESFPFSRYRNTSNCTWNRKN
jgi:DNA (cytosine-5)-methyltransferase 1